jgi:D-alanine-D-alanine ligase
LPDRVRLVVLFGGRSAEHDISRISASHVLRAVDPQRYEVLPVGIAKDGRWVLAEQAAELIGRGLQAELPASIPVAGPDVDPLPTLTERALGEPAGEPGPVTVVLPILHGPNGEDGTVQGLLETAGLPYVGSGVLGSALAMDKVMAKTVLDAAGIAQPAWRSVRASQVRGAAESDRAVLAQRLLSELGETVFVKPANMGSSIGVSRATGPDHLLAALDTAFSYDDWAVIEEAVHARELEIAVLGNERPRASVVGEIVPAAEFYDYEDKYRDGAARTVIPAELDGDLAEDLRHLAVRTFLALRAEGMARVDVFLEHDGPDGAGRGVLVNEINTIPGFTPISMYPMLWQESGLSYPELIDELVALALERHERRAQHRTDVQPRAQDGPTR